EQKFKKGTLRRSAADGPHRGDERKEREADDPHLVAYLHRLPGDGRAHDRGSRRTQARPGVHLRADGRPQAGRVRADPDLPRPLRRPQDRSEEANLMSVVRFQLTPVKETMFPSRAPFFRDRLSPRAAEIAAWAEENRRGNLPVSPFAPSTAHRPEGGR